MHQAARVSVLFVLLQASYSAASYAESCTDTGAPSVDPEDDEQVFVGTASRTGLGCGNTQRVHFDVETGIVGVSDGETVKVKATDPIGSGGPIDRGERWLVFADSTGRFSTDYCSESRHDPSEELDQRLVEQAQ